MRLLLASRSVGGVGVVLRVEGRVALMSIRPVYADAILAGVKRVEFRKRPLAADVSSVVVYASAPAQAIVGRFEVAGQVVVPPRELLERFRVSGAVADDAGFLEYFAGRDVGVGIEVGEVEVFDPVVSLSEVVLHGHPPQSFCYLDDAALERLERCVR